MKKEIKLSRIHCAACAINLEDKIREVDGVQNAQVDFEKKSVVVTAKDKEVIERVKTTITKFDSSIKIIDTSQEERQEKLEKIHKIADITKIFVSIILAVVAYFVPILWLSISLYVLSYLSVGYEVLYIAVKNLLKGKMLDENFLMSVATIGALALQDFIEAIAVMLFYSVGEVFEQYAVSKSRSRVKSLLNIKADYANLVTKEGEVQVNLDKVKVGDLIRIKPGEKVPLDCIVVEGRSSLSTAVITGESKELFATEKTELLSGYLNGDGVLLCKVQKTEKDSAVTKIIEMVENATKSKAKTEKFITKFAKIYTPIVVGAAVLLAIIPSLIWGSFNDWLYRALTFLVVSCPCALVISIPLGYFAGIGASARMGVLVKGSSYLELLSKVNTVVFDKTGTLTYGNFEVEKVFAKENTSEKEVLELVAYAESFSNHRIAKSIVRKYEKPINTAFVSDYKEIAGMGVEANLFGEQCVVGNANLLRQKGIEFEEVDEAGTLVYLAKNNEYMGYVLIVDKIKEDSAEALKELKKLGVKNVSMFTGDNEKVASAVAGQLGLDSYYSSLMPEQKVANLSKLNSDGNYIAFVGDGVNDAPVLASVDVGVSMGGIGSDVAIEASDVVLMTDEPRKLVDAIKIAKKTRKIILENIYFILAFKVAVLILTALGLSGMWLAIFADVGLAILAILNSLRAMITKKPKKSSKPKQEIKDELR